MFLRSFSPRSAKVASTRREHGHRRCLKHKCPWLADAFEPCCDIYAVANNVVALDQHVAEVDADAVEDPLVFRGFGVALSHQLLDGDGAFDGGDHRGKLHEEAVARRLDDAAAVPTTIGVDASCPSRTAFAVPASSWPMSRE
jgi:hypothetical protein